MKNRLIAILLSCLLASSAYADTAFTSFNYLATGGATSRKDPDRWVDFWISAKDGGVDCSGATDSASALQALINSLPDASSIKFPNGCQVLLGSTISITDRVDIQLTSEALTRAGGTGNSPTFIWNASGGTMFSVLHSRGPVFRGMNFICGSGKTIDKFIDFDGEPVAQIGSAGVVSNFGMTCNGQSNASFVGISISATAVNNHENYQITNGNISCSGSRSLVRSQAGVINSGSPNLAATGAAFVSGDVGKRIVVSYATGALETTISSVSDSTHVVMAANATSNQTSATVHVGTGYGIAVYNGPSPNAKHQEFSGIQYDHCAFGIKVDAGSARISHIGGGSSNVGIALGGSISEPTSILFYEAESDERALAIANPVTAITVANSRFDNTSARADGFINFTGSGTYTVLQGNALQQVGSYPANTILIGGLAGNASVVSLGNYWSPASWTQIGYDQAINVVDAITSLQDIFGGATAPASAYIGGGIASPVITGVGGGPGQRGVATSPGTFSGKMQFVCGTNAGTAKLVVYAGTSTTPITIQDNVGSGVSGC